MPPSSLRAAELFGRLGNQLFQFAAVAALLDDGQPVPVETLRAGDWLDGTVRPDAYRLLTPRESLALGRPPIPPKGPARRALARLVDTSPDHGRSGALGRHVYAEPTQGAFDPAFAAAPAPVLYSGFFQHEGYFRDRADRVVGALLPATTAVDPHRSGDEMPTCAVVIRAGVDYVKIGWDLPFGWYERAATHVASKLPSCRFLVFSDVPIAAEAAARSLSGLGPASAVVGLNTCDQLHLIASCDHAVVASSTFAWWGAWLGDAMRSFAADRIVVAPTPWIFPELDVVPERWTTQADDRTPTATTSTTATFTEVTA